MHQKNRATRLCGAFIQCASLSLAFVITVVMLLSACQQLPRPRNEQLQVVASIYPVADWARQIGGNKVEVYTLLPAGVSPHTFEPTPTEVRRLAQADIFLKIGLGLESWAEKLVEATAGSRLRVVTLADNLTVPFTTNGLTIQPTEHYEAGAYTEYHHFGTDPHVWLDPVLAQDMVTAIARTFEDVDPTNAQYYKTRVKDYSAQLRMLDEEIRHTVSGFTSRELVTVHSMLHYFALRYGLHQATVIEASPGKVPSPADINRVIELLRAMDRPVIFVEPQLSDKTARVIAEETGAAVDVLDPLGTPDTPDRDTYIKLMRYNMKTLEQYMK